MKDLRRGILIGTSPFALLLAVAITVAIMASAVMTPQADTRAVSKVSKPPKRSSSPPSTLTFRMTTRMAYQGAHDSTPGPEQLIDAKVYVRGNRVRVESRLSNRPIVVLYASPYIYRLLPATKTGVRFRTNSSSTSSALTQFDPQALMRDPLAIRKVLYKQGARRVGTARMQGVLLDVYTANNFMGKSQKVKAWLRHSDALPVRLQLTSKKLKVTASWRDYRRNRILPGSLFAVPSNYHIRDAQGQPPTL